jgi:hypothetical protein
MLIFELFPLFVMLVAGVVVAILMVKRRESDNDGKDQ